jgi:uncharacterized protein (TIGR02996 family)
MSEERDLLRAIAHDPDDDAPRLVFSDWLEEHGQPERAAFIRTQVRLGTLTEDSPERRELAFLCRQLLDQHEQAWMKPLRGIVLEWGWSRGFLEVMDCDPDSLAECGDEHFDTYPLRRLLVSDLRGKVDDLALIPADNHLIGLELIGNGLDLREVRKLAKFGQFDGLRELNLMFNSLHDSAVGILCKEPFFQRLSLLHLACNPFTERGRQRLRDYFGDRVSFTRERYPARLFAIQDDRIRVGWCRDLTQLLMYGRMEHPSVAFFDHAGNLLRIEQRSEAGQWAVRDAWLEEVGYQSATIKVKRFNFEPDRGGIYDFADGWCDVFDRPGNLEIRRARDWLEQWLAEDKFAWGRGAGDIWLDRKSGEVTDT